MSDQDRTIDANPSFAVIGCGAVGGYYGGRLLSKGKDVHFLLRSDYEHIKANGLRIDSVHGDMAYERVNAYNDTAAMPRCDVVIVAMKVTSNDALRDLLPPLMKDNSVVLVLQNGLGVEEGIGEIVGHDRVIGGLCFICSQRVGPGHIDHTDYGRIEMAEHTQGGGAVGITPRLKTIGGIFEQPGVPIVLNNDLVLSRWKKLVWNVPFNGLSVALDADTKQIMSDPDHRAHAHELMCEVQAAARASAGRVIEDGLIESMLESTEKMVPYYPSMKLDYEADRAMEVEAIFGNPLRAARSAGCDTPRLEALYQRLKSMSAQPGE